MRQALAIAIVWLATCLPLAGCGRREPPPDVVLVVVDALRRDHLGLYGHDAPTSPFFDRLGAEGLVFEGAYAQSAATFLSTATLLTGRYLPLLGKPPAELPADQLREAELRRHARVPHLRQENLTLAELFRDAGYETVGLFTNPHHHETSGFWQGFDTARYLPPDRGTGYARATSVRTAFFDWLDERQRGEAPFFAYLHVMDVHNPYRPPRPFRRAFVTARGTDRYINGKPPPGEEPTPEDLETMSQLYEAEIAYVDGVLGELVAELERRRGDFVFVLASDHGDEFMEHGGLGHGKTLHGELLRVPLVIAGPGVGAARVPGLVRNLDLMPTLAELIGLPLPDDLDGVSLLPLAAADRRAAPTSSLASSGPLRSITTDRWHCIWDRADDRVSLYDLDADPGETVDVAPLHPELAGAFRATLRQQERRAARLAEAGAEAEPPPPPDAAILEQLESLGYLD